MLEIIIESNALGACEVIWWEWDDILNVVVLFLKASSRM